MEDSPAKRRKTSPTTSVAINAPTTPSRIPVSVRDGGNATPGRPSYVSPTKASLSRHNPQLLRQPPSSGVNTHSPGSQVKGQDLQDLFSKALSEVQSANDAPSIITGEDRDGTKSLSTTQENEPQDIIPSATTPRATTARSRGTRTAGGGFSARPRRLSQSPAKSPSKRPQKAPAGPVDDFFDKELPDDFNPFQKKGLRRSPITSQVESEVPAQDNTNPFRATGLRRSPIASLAEMPVVPDESDNPFRRTERRKSPIASQVETGASSQGIDDPFRKTERRKSGNGLFQGNERRPSPVPSQQENHLPLREGNVLLPGPNWSKSPISLQPTRSSHGVIEQTERSPEVSTTPTDPLPSHAALAEVISKSYSEVNGIRKPDQQPLFSKVADLLQGRSSRREEPELPPTPIQRGIPDPIVTTPPTGIHDTPSKRARKDKVLAEKLKSSPLKSRGPAPPGPEKATPLEALQKPQSEKLLGRQKPVRVFIPKDPHAAKKKERDDLLKELQQLRADVTLANQENERLRLRTESKHNKPAPSPNVEDLVSMLVRSTAPEPSVLKPKPASIFKSISSFLPFRPRRKPTTAAISVKPLPSYLPLRLDDPLPYLQAFSPLAYTSTITLLPPAPVSPDTSEELEQPILQRHVINASHRSGLFTSRFAMTVDISSLSISSLEILRLDMPAERELGTFIRSRARSSGPLGRDVTAICWAMGRWTEVSIERARFWCDVEHDFGTAASRKKSLQRRRKRKRPGTILADDDDSGIEEEGNGDARKAKWTRRQLLPNIGRTALELSSQEVELRFEWKLDFDWTGEVESHISSNARLPRNWLEKDDRKSLGKVPEIFSKLVKEKGPLGAARAIVGLFMPSQ